MHYYVIQDDMELKGTEMFGDFLRPKGEEVLTWDCSVGKPVEWSGPLTVELIRKGDSIDSGFNAFGTLVVRDKCRRVFEKVAPGSVQYIPLTIPTDPQLGYIANITLLVDCLDEKLSHVERFIENDPVRPDRAGEISLVADLHIDAERAEGQHLFRLRSYPNAVIVSEKLKYALEEAGIIGLKFHHATSPDIAEYRKMFKGRGNPHRSTWNNQ